MNSSAQEQRLPKDLHPVTWYAKRFGGDDAEEVRRWKARLKQAVRDSVLRAWRFDKAANAQIYLKKSDVELFVEEAGERQLALSPAEDRAIDAETL